MMQHHDHSEFMRVDEIRLLVESLRDHFDGRFDLVDMQQKQHAHTLKEVVDQQRETNGQVAKLQLWRATITGHVDGLKAAAGGAQRLWIVLIAAFSASITLAGLIFAVGRAIIGA